MKKQRIEIIIEVAILLLLALSIYLIVACTVKRKIILPGHSPATVDKNDGHRFVDTIYNNTFQLPLTR